MNAIDYSKPIESVNTDTLYIDKSYNLIIKNKGFNPSPYAGKIPFFADSIANPKCVGSRLYLEFWEEQFYYCMYGYTTGGLWIPGKYYDYLNFQNVDGVGSGNVYPYFVDLHYELFRIEDAIRKDKSLAGGVFPKARRKGLSFFFKEILHHGARFIDAYRAGVAGGLDDYVKAFRSKLYRTMNNTVPEMRMGWNQRNMDLITLGWEEKTENGMEKKEHATILFQTMQDDASKFEGEYFHDILYEETGQFKKAEDAHMANVPAMMDGDDFIGKSWFIGTGGDMAKGGKTFSTIFANNKAYNLVNMFVPGKRYYTPYIRRPKDKYDVNTPNLDKMFPDLSEEQLLGCEDVDAAMAALKMREADYRKNPDKTKYIKHKQNFPENVQDVFISSGTNNFDTEKLFLRNFYLNSQPSQKYREVVFEWAKNDKGEIQIPLAVTFRSPKKDDPEWKIVKIYKDASPVYSSTDVMGIDGYNEDVSTTTKSLGAFVVLRQYNLYKDANIQEPGIVPIAMYYKRPPRKELFFEISLQVAVYYNLVKNVLVSAESDLVIKYFKDQGAKKYLSKRPVAFDSPDSQLKHEYGIKMNAYSKPRMIAVMQTYVDYNIDYCWFQEICSDLAAYDSENIGTDWDLADALGIALCLIEDRKKKMKQLANPSQVQYEPEIEWVTGPDGIMIPRIVDYDHQVAQLFKQGEDWKKFKNSFNDDL